MWDQEYLFSISEWRNSNTNCSEYAEMLVFNADRKDNHNNHEEEEFFQVDVATECWMFAKVKSDPTNGAGMKPRLGLPQGEKLAHLQARASASYYVNLIWDVFSL